jgi:predicted nucleic acid-binding protein
MSLVVDSSGWIEFFTDGPNCDHFTDAIVDSENLYLPTIVLLEVYRWILREESQSAAQIAVATMKQWIEIPLDANLAIRAADSCAKLKLPLADSIIYTTARYWNAEILTQDADFEGLPYVQYVRYPNL